MSKKMKFRIKDKETGEEIKEAGAIFKTKLEAEIWCESHGIDYDYWEIK